MKIVDWIVDRLKEKSTWLGITALLSAAGVVLAPEQLDAIATAGVAIAGAIAIFTKENTPE